jgi:hypothetical protein|tara:strand:+ start:900 stop:1295 length:396 start_codon:yes stop_codon:yes gene_type:complete
MQYIKHYYVDAQNGSYCCETSSNPKYKRHPVNEYAGLSVKVWLTDSDGVDVCLAELPDSTSVSTIANGSKNSVKVLTEAEYNTVWTPYSEGMGLYGEESEARNSGDDSTADAKKTAGDAKMAEATTAIRAL